MLVDDLDGRAEILEHLAHYVDIGDVGDVGEGAHALGHKRSGHKLKRRVLCSLDGHLASNGVATLDLDDVHEPSVCKRT